MAQGSGLEHDLRRAWPREALAQQPDVIQRVIDRAGSGAEPLVIVVEQAEALREEELRPVIEASRHAPRSVILRVIHAVEGEAA